MASRHTTPLPLPLEFPPDSAGSASPPDAETLRPGGITHAIQDDSPRPDPGEPGAARAAPQQPDAAFDREFLCDRAEGQPRDVEGAAQPVEAGQRPEPDRQRGDGTGSAGTD